MARSRPGRSGQNQFPGALTGAGDRYAGHDGYGSGPLTFNLPRSVLLPGDRDGDRGPQFASPRPVSAPGTLFDASDLGRWDLAITSMP